MKIQIIDNFFEDLLPIHNKVKSLKFYKLKEFNTKFKTNHNWPGVRTEIIPKVDLELSQIVMKVFLTKFRNFLDSGNSQITMYAHQRDKKDSKKDWIHNDSDVSKYTCLIYLSKNNLNSGTKFYNAKKQVINDVKFVQNRALIFDSRYLHSAYGHHNGRLNLSLFIKHEDNKNL